MKVALAGTFVGAGGVQTHLLWLSRALRDAGHDVLIISLGRQGNPLGDSHGDCGDGPGCLLFCHPYRAGSGWRSSWWALTSILRVLRDFKPDVYLGCGTGGNVFLPAIVTSTRPIKIFHEVMSGESAGWSDTRWLARYCFDVIVAQASAVAGTFKTSFAWPRQITVLPAFPEPLERSGSARRATLKRVPMGLARAAMFGRLVPHKRAYWLVQQWPELSTCLKELHIFGTGPEERQIRELIVANGWEDVVFCHGAYPADAAYTDLLYSFDLTLLPTVGAEGAPLVLLESMSCGVPFVATDAGGISDYANADCIVVPGSTPQGFLAAVKELTERLDAGTISQERLQEFYRAHFSFAELSRRWLAFLADVCRGTRSDG